MEDTKEKIEDKEEKILVLGFLQKLLIGTVVMCGVFGIASVDASYADMMDKDSKLQIQVRRINEENLKVKIFGEVVYINDKEIKEGIEYKYNNVKEFFNNIETL